FRGNSGKQGLLAAQVEQSDVELLWKLMEEQPGVELEVDLESRTVACGGVGVPFQIDDYTRWRLMEGLDDIGLTLQHEEDIEAYEEARPSFKPTTLPARS
ncbi:MAG TPA: 3-isopropylmalate dehydratase small subunit, partial [Kocuria sp.]|nr:3-isopropylmalate dehydratase small subunit [Kocuria sp.]